MGRMVDSDDDEGLLSDEDDDIFLFKKKPKPSKSVKQKQQEEEAAFNILIAKERQDAERDKKIAARAEAAGVDLSIDVLDQIDSKATAEFLAHTKKADERIKRVMEEEERELEDESMKILGACEMFLLEALRPTLPQPLLPFSLLPSAEEGVEVLYQALGGIGSCIEAIEVLGAMLVPMWLEKKQMGLPEPVGRWLFELAAHHNNLAIAESALENLVSILSSQGCDSRWSLSLADIHCVLRTYGVTWLQKDADGQEAGEGGQKMEKKMCCSCKPFPSLPTERHAFHCFEELLLPNQRSHSTAFPDFPLTTIVNREPENGAPPLNLAVFMLLLEQCLITRSHSLTDEDLLTLFRDLAFVMLDEGVHSLHRCLSCAMRVQALVLSALSEEGWQSGRSKLVDALCHPEKCQLMRGSMAPLSWVLLLRCLPMQPEAKPSVGAQAQPSECSTSPSHRGNRSNRSRARQLQAALCDSILRQHLLQSTTYSTTEAGALPSTLALAALTAVAEREDNLTELNDTALSRQYAVLSAVLGLLCGSAAEEWTGQREELDAVDKCANTILQRNNAQLIEMHV
ncbi:unnamed protein product [Chrysoparadoxa australica]